MLDPDLIPASQLIHTNQPIKQSSHRLTRDYRDDAVEGVDLDAVECHLLYCILMEESDLALTQELHRLALLPEHASVAQLDGDSFMDLLTAYLQRKGRTLPPQRLKYGTAVQLAKEMSGLTRTTISVDLFLSFSLPKARQLLLTMLALEDPEDTGAREDKMRKPGPF
jgi:hypothetical protein